MLNIQLLNDIPASYETDATPRFKAHEVIARSLCELVQTQPGGKFVAIEGDWGSGKSTIISLLAKKFAGSKGLDVEVTIFDAWAHSGDFLRRTFLETIVGQLCAADSKWISKKHWDDVISKLSNKTKTTETTTRSTVPKIALWLSLSVLFLPLGGGLLVSGLQRPSDISPLQITGELQGTLALPREPGEVGRYFDQEAAHALLSITGTKPQPTDGWHLLGMNFPTLLGTALVLIPIIWLIGFYIYGLVRRTSAAFDDSFKVLINKADTNVLSTSNDSGDPSSIEFEKHFASLMREAIHEKTRRIVLVIDNLDRIDPEDARLIWSTMRTFLQPSEHQRPEWLSRLWVVVPYDPTAIAKHLDKPGSLTSSPTVPGRAVSAGSFLDKAFQVRFRLPPPLVSEWRSYFDELVQHVIPAASATERHFAYRIFARHLDKQGRLPTARDIKLFANRLGVLQLECEGSIGIAECALFSVYQDRQDILFELQANKFPSYPDPTVRDFFGPELPDRMAALYYGVDVESARSLLLLQPIRIALNAGDSKTLSALLSSAPNFWPVFEEAFQGLSAEWPVSGASQLVKALEAITGAQILENAPIDGQKIWISSGLRNAVAHIYDWRPFNADIRKGLETFFSQFNAPHLVDHVLRQTTSFPTKTPRGPIPSLPDFHEWSATISAVIKIAEHQHPAVLEGFKCDIELDEQHWQSFIHAAEPNIPATLRNYLPLANTLKTIIPGLIKTIESAQFRSEQVIVLRFLLDGTTIEKPIDTTPLIKAIHARVRRQEDMEAPELDSLIHALMFDNAHYAGPKALSEVIDAGVIHHHLNRAFDRGNDALIGLIVSALLLRNPKLPQPPGFGNASHGFSRMTELFSRRGKRPEAVRRVELVLNPKWSLERLTTFIAGDATNRAWFLEILARRCASKDEVQKLSAKQIVAVWPQLRKLLLSEQSTGEDKKAYDAFVKLAAVSGDTRGRLLAGSYDPGLADAYLAVLREQSDRNDRILLGEKLSQIDTPTWKKDLESPTALTEIARILTEDSEIEFSLDVSYFDALKIHLESKFQEKASKDSVLANIGKYTSLLSINYRLSLQRHLLKAFIRTKSATPSHCFEAFPPAFFAEEVILNEDELVSGLFEPLIESKSSNAIKWVLAVIQTYPGLVKGKFVAGDAVDVFRDRVHKNLRDPAFTTLQNELTELTKALGPGADKPKPQTA